MISCFNLIIDIEKRNTVLILKDLAIWTRANINSVNR